MSEWLDCIFFGFFCGVGKKLYLCIRKGHHLGNGNEKINTSSCVDGYRRPCVRAAAVGL
jgi:hypothetical protein